MKQIENKSGLVLRKTSLRVLNDIELNQVAGGYVPNQYEQNSDCGGGNPHTSLTDQCPPSGRD